MNDREYSYIKLALVRIQVNMIIYCIFFLKWNILVQYPNYVDI